MQKGLLLMAAAAIVATPGCELQEPPRSFGKASAACQISVEGLEESSGIAPSLASPGWFYTHNDDDDPMRYWKFKLTGETQGPFVLPAIKNRDVEDMASAKFGGVNYLYFADIGDNGAQYDSVRVMRCAEPAATKGEQRKVDIFTLHYPDKPRNAESFFVQRDNGAFWIIEKSQSSAGVYRCASPKPGDNRLEKMGEIKLPAVIASLKLITGAAVSPDNKHVIIRTYTVAYEYSAGTSFEDWFKKKPREVKLGIEGQGEAICYSATDDELVTTSEGKPCPVSRLPLQKMP